MGFDHILLCTMVVVLQNATPNTYLAFYVC